MRFITKGISAIVLAGILFSAHSQEGVIENFVLGKKVSPFVLGLETYGPKPSLTLFGKVGPGYSTNVFKAPQNFNSSPSGSAPSQIFSTQVNMAQADAFGSFTGGFESAMKRGNHRARLMLAGQHIRYNQEDLANTSSLNLYTRYRYKFSDRFRLDWENQVDRNIGTSTFMYGTKSLLNIDNFLHMESILQFQLETVRLPFIGTGQTELMASFRYRDYKEPNLDASIPVWGTDGPEDLELLEYCYNGLNAPFTINDTLEADYYQYRFRLRQIQGLWRGLGIRISGDYIKRNYINMWEKKADPWQEGDTLFDPSTETFYLFTSSEDKATEWNTEKDDTVEIAGNQWIKGQAQDYFKYRGVIPFGADREPSAPHRNQHEIRAYLGMQFDPPNLNDARINLGGEYLTIIDPFEGFYGYNQWTVKGNAYYRPTSLSWIDLSFATKFRRYTKLKTNYIYGELLPNTSRPSPINSRLIAPELDGGELIRVSDTLYNTDWQTTPLQTTLFEMHLRGQREITPFLAIWGLYSLEMRETNRLFTEYFSREFSAHSFGAGITFYLDMLGVTDHSVIKYKN